MLVIIILIAVVVAFVAIKLWHGHKMPRSSSLTFISGGVKTGKTTLAVRMAIVNYRRAVRRWRITSALSFLKKSWRNQEKPLLYSNIPLTVPYVPVTRKMLLRQERFNYRSVILLSEFSLIADSQLIHNNELNDNALLFFKLIAHETRGGMVIVESQCPSDCHYSLRRCLSETFYIHHIFKWCPFFIIAWVIEQRYSDDGTIVTAQIEDVEENLKWLLIPKKTWKVFDCYTYSELTDGLSPVTHTYLGLRGKLKSKNIISFRDRGWVRAVNAVENKKNNKVPIVSDPLAVPIAVSVDSSAFVPVDLSEVLQNEKKDD